MVCGSATILGEYSECQNVALFPSMAALAGLPLSWSLATAVQPAGVIGSDAGVNASAVVASTICM